jgi:hypothetical protein
MSKNMIYSDIPSDLRIVVIGDIISQARSKGFADAEILMILDIFFVESMFIPTAKSSSSAKGIGQLTYFAVKQVFYLRAKNDPQYSGENYKDLFFTTIAREKAEVFDYYDFHQNIDVSLDYIKYIKQMNSYNLITNFEDVYKIYSKGPK